MRINKLMISIVFFRIKCNHVYGGGGEVDAENAITLKQRTNSSLLIINIFKRYPLVLCLLSSGRMSEHLECHMLCTSTQMICFTMFKRVHSARLNALEAVYVHTSM